MATYTSNYAWTKPSGSDQVNIEELNDNLDSQDSIIHDAFLNMAEPFSELSTYAVGDIRLYGTKTYICTVPVTTPGAWTGSTNWDEYKLSEGGGGQSGGEVKNLDNGMLSHSTDSSYITVNLAVALTAGKEYKITLRDPAYNYVDTKQIVWVPSTGVTFVGNGGGPYAISLTETTVSLYSYGGQGWRDIYCDIISDFETVTAAQTTYDNTTSGLTADDVQEAIDELATEKADKSDIAPEFNTTTAYAKGDLSYHDGTLYEFNQAHAAGVWDASHADAKDVDGAIADAFNAVSVYTNIKTVTSDGIKTWKTLINELFDGVNVYLSSDIVLTIAQSRFIENYAASTTKRFTSIYGALNVESVTYNPGTPANTSYVTYGLTTSGITESVKTDVVPASGERLRIYIRSR